MTLGPALPVACRDSESRMPQLHLEAGKTNPGNGPTKIDQFVSGAGP